MNRTAAFVVGLAAVAALPFALRGLRPDAATRCALDGVTIDPRYVVRIEDAGGAHRFCCPSCAATWAARTPVGRDGGGRRAFVVDEESGREIDARDAWFVRSQVVAVPATESRVHAFATETAARRHADEFRGTTLVGDERPLRAVEEGAPPR